ncbi:MAG: isoprenylcysteine carboxylmethyltransferase family protein [Asgard group archaeon]|nr:isoprenylcysteine carboxylmethyltransferase family protein [Asgard group archaeon]
MTVQEDKSQKSIENTDKERQEWKTNWLFVIIASIQFLSMVGQIILIGFFFENHNIKSLPIIGCVIISIAFVFLASGSIVLYERVENKEKRRPRIRFEEKGIYTIIRHPMYLGLMILFIGMMFISDLRWSSILAFPSIIIMYYYMIKEESIFIERFGEDFKEYMDRVPRMDIFLGIYRKIKKQYKKE